MAVGAIAFVYILSLHAIYPSRLHRAAKVRAFIEFCLEILEKAR